MAVAPNLGADRSGMLADRTAMDHARSGFDDRSRTKTAWIEQNRTVPGIPIFLNRSTSTTVQYRIDITKKFLPTVQYSS